MITEPPPFFSLIPLEYAWTPYIALLRFVTYTLQLLTFQGYRMAQGLRRFFLVSVVLLTTPRRSFVFHIWPMLFFFLGFDCAALNRFTLTNLLPDSSIALESAHLNLSTYLPPGFPEIILLRYRALTLCRLQWRPQ